MREVKYISSSSYSKFVKAREEFYTKYLMENRPPRPPQFIFMAVGSAFDGYAKHQIYEDIFGAGSSLGTDYELETILETQVEENFREDAVRRAIDLWKQYNESGAYKSLIDDIAKSPVEPRMELTIKDKIQGVMLLGKPDLVYETPEGVLVVSDWKCNGSTSNTGASPAQGYQVVRDNWNSTSHEKPHKKYKGVKYKDVEHDASCLSTKPSFGYWADQLSIYAWLLGEEVGSQKFVVRMEQITCRPVKGQDLPRAKFSSHFNKVEQSFQTDLMEGISNMRKIIDSGHIFDQLTREESDSKIELLELRAANPINPYIDMIARYQTRKKAW